LVIASIMFERFTESARRVLFWARYEVSQLGGSTIETGHVLLGLVRDDKGKGIVAHVLSASHVSAAELCEEIRRRLAAPEKISTSVEMPFSAETKHVLELAADEADRMAHASIGQEHLLVGLLREEQSLAAKVLNSRGLSLESARNVIATAKE
jgi:ATP-dependent Clp protease ATP-binding subunit ClpC